MSSIVLEFDRNPNISEVDRLQSLMESVQRAFNELEITFDDLELDKHPVVQRVTGDFGILFKDYAEFKVISTNAIEAVKGEFKRIDTEYLKVKDAEVDYAKIDKANIDQAWIEDLLVKGNFLASDVNSGTGSFSKYLTGVNIIGDNITAGTITTDRLVIRDPENNTGILYEINNGVVDQSDLTEEELKRLTLDGKVITAESITAEQINVYDLFAQNITSTGDFNMGGKGALVYDSKADELSMRVKELFIGTESAATQADITALGKSISLTVEDINKSIAGIKATADGVDLYVKQNLDGNELISRINLDSTTATIQAKHINLTGSVTIAMLDDDLGGSFVTDENGVTQIDGGNIKTGTVKAAQIDVENLFAQDIDASGTITGLALVGGTISGTEFVSAGTPPTDVLGTDLSLFIAESTLTANSSVLSMHGSNDIESVHTAFGSKYYAEDIEYASLVDAALYTTPLGIRYKVRETGASKLTDYFVVDYTGVRWQGKPLATTSDLQQYSLATHGHTDYAAADHEHSEYFKTEESKSAMQQAMGIDTGYISSINVPANGYVDATLEFNKAFTETPHIVCSIYTTANGVGNGSMEAVVAAKSPKGATIRIMNNSAVTGTRGIEWVAIGN